jgi:hypothetical protein
MLQAWRLIFSYTLAYINIKSKYNVPIANRVKAIAKNIQLWYNIMRLSELAQSTLAVISFLSGDT